MGSYLDCQVYFFFWLLFSIIIDGFSELCKVACWYLRSLGLILWYRLRFFKFGNIILVSLAIILVYLALRGVGTHKNTRDLFNKSEREVSAFFSLERIGYWHYSLALWTLRRWSCCLLIKWGCLTRSSWKTCCSSEGLWLGGQAPSPSLLLTGSARAAWSNDTQPQVSRTV